MGTVSATPTAATFTPRKNLTYDTAYTASLGRDAQDLARNGLAQGYTWAFTTVSPREGAQRVSNGVILSATFSESVTCSSVTAATFKLTGPSGRIDNDNNLYIAGSSEKNMSGAGSQGGFDAVLTKMDTVGNILWTTQFGTPFEDQAQSIAIEANTSIYIAGHTLGDFSDPVAHTNADAFLTKIDKNGAIQWTKQLGSTGNDEAHSVVTDNNGGIYLAGFATGSVLGNTAMGGSDLLLSKFTADGQRQWTKQLGTGGDDVAFTAATDPEGNIFIGGTTQGTLDENAYFGGQDGFVIKYNSVGEKQ